MRLLLIIVGAFAAIVCIEKPAEAQNYPWCADGNCNMATMHGHRERKWRVLWTQSNVPAPGTTCFGSAPEAPSALKAVPSAKTRAAW
jgi:hypothetical protein